MNIKIKFGYRLKELRKFYHLSQEQLASRANLHRTYISDIERGTKNISLENIYKLAVAFEISLMELFDF